jgi:protein-disulfide isomerase
LATFYVLLGIIAVVGVGIVGAIALRGSAPTTTAPITTLPAAINAPTGRTSDGFYYKGSPDAPVKVVEYADFQCPACAQFATRLEGTLNKAYIESGKVQLIYHEFPLPQHANAVKSAEAARCAGDQGKFWQMHDLLFSRQNEWENAGNPTRLFGNYATALGLNQQAFSSCLATGTYTKAVTEAGTVAQTAGIQQTPTFVVGGKQVFANDLQAAIDAALQAKGS